MKPLLLLSLTIAIQSAPYPKVRYYNVSGPYTFIAGQRSVLFFKPDYGFDFTCATSGMCTAGNGYTPINGTVGTADSTGGLPGGVETMTQNAWPLYAICDISGLTFQLHQNTCSGLPVVIANTGTGTHTFSIYNYGAKKIYLDAAPAGLPTSTAVTWKTGTGGNGYTCHDAAPTESGKVYRPAGGDGSENHMCMFITPPSNATPGTGTMVTTWCETVASSNCNSFSWPYEIVSISATVPSAPASFSAIPGKSSWVTTMTAGVTSGDELGGGTYCTNRTAPTETFVSCPEQAVSYYDGGLSYLNIARYSRDSSWKSCGQNIINYCKAYVDANNGGIPAYKIFCEGFTRAAEEFGNTAYATTAGLLANSTYLTYGALPRLGNDREMAYALTVAVCLSRNLGISNPFTADLRDGVYGLILRYTETSSANRAETQGFYMGLMLKAIIYDWQTSGDVRAPYVVKRGLDRLWATYNQTSHTMMYATGAGGGPWCVSAYLWFQGDPYSNCQVNSGQKLQGLVSPAFAWYYALTGDATYRDRGDDWFQHTFDAGIYTGKEFAQVYYWTFNYVGWREGSLSPSQWYGDNTTITTPSPSPRRPTGASRNGAGGRR